MSNLGANEELLQDFLREATELLEGVEHNLIVLEKQPKDSQLLNDIFRSFHTLKGGAGFLNLTDLVSLCHLTENLFDKLRHNELTLNGKMMDAILAATTAVNKMFKDISSGKRTQLDSKLINLLQHLTDTEVHQDQSGESNEQVKNPELNWVTLYQALTDLPIQSPLEAANASRGNSGRRSADDPNVVVSSAGRRETDKIAISREKTIRVDTVRLDEILNLAGEIGLVKNRLNALRGEMLQGKNETINLSSLDKSLAQLSLLVGDLQNAVMKSRMQPIAKLFQKYPRIARDLGGQLGKDVVLEISGEETKLDKTMIEELSDPLVHLVRNAIDHGIELPEQRHAAGKREKATIRLKAEQVGDRIIIEVNDDGRGMTPEALRQKALEKGLINVEQANSMDDRQSLQLIFLPGFSTKEQISSISGRGVGMDVVKTNIQKLNGQIEILSESGRGTTFTISLPLTLAILPVLIVQLDTQLFALPLTLVREILRINPENVQTVSGRPTVVVRDEVLPLRSLSSLLGWSQKCIPSYGIVLESTSHAFILAVDQFIGRDDVVIKPLTGIKPKGIAGATLSANGSVVLILDIEELLAFSPTDKKVALFAKAA